MKKAECKQEAKRSIHNLFSLELHKYLLVILPCIIIIILLLIRLGLTIEMDFSCRNLNSDYYLFYSNYVQQEISGDDGGNDDGVKEEAADDEPVNLGPDGPVD